MAMVDVDDSSLQAESHSVILMTWSEGQRPLGAVLHSSDERVNSKSDFGTMTAP